MNFFRTRLYFPLFTVGAVHVIANKKLLTMIKNIDFIQKFHQRGLMMPLNGLGARVTPS